jgi:apolipoprotein D and lipocalin family protein
MAKKINRFSLKKYLGKWHEQGSIPLWFSKGCSHSEANYSVNPDGSVAVLNVCKKNGEIDFAEGKAYPTNKKRLLSVGFFPKFFPLFRSPYSIEYLEENNKKYSAAIVRGKRGAWILTRKKNISGKEYKRLLKKADELGIDTKQIKKTRQ